MCALTAIWGYFVYYFCKNGAGIDRQMQHVPTRHLDTATRSDGNSDKMYIYRQLYER